MISLDDVVSLSRIQFGATAMFHFLFVPLTLGLSWILVLSLIHISPDQAGLWPAVCTAMVCFGGRPMALG